VISFLKQPATDRRMMIYTQDGKYPSQQENTSYTLEEQMQFSRHSRRAQFVALHLIHAHIKKAIKT